MEMLLLYSCSVMSNSLQPHGLQLPCLLPSPRVCSNSCPLSWWCHPTILSSVVPFSSCVSELCLNAIDNVHISMFVFPGSWAGWVQVSSSSQPFMDCDFTISCQFCFKNFAVVFRSVPHAWHPVARLRPGGGLSVSLVLQVFDMLTDAHAHAHI